MCVGNIALESSALPMVQADGAAALALRCMTAHATSPVTQAAGLRLVACLATGGPELRADLAEAGVIGALHGALASHGKDPTVYQQCACVLSRMASDEAHRTACAEALRDVIGGMAAAAADADSLTYAIAFVQELVLEARFRPVVAAAGAVQAIIRAMRPHTTVVALQRGACTAITALLKDEATSVPTRSIVALAENLTVVNDAAAVAPEQVRILQAVLESILVAPSQIVVAAGAAKKKK